MSSIFVTAGIISITFFIMKFIEMRFIYKESKPLKILVRDTLIVYFSVLMSNFIMDQLNPIITIKGGASKYLTPVFTDEPGF